MLFLVLFFKTKNTITYFLNLTEGYVDDFRERKGKGRELRRERKGAGELEREREKY